MNRTLAGTRSPPGAELRQALRQCGHDAPPLVVYPHATPPHATVSIRNIEEDHFTVADYGNNAGGSERLRAVLGQG